MTGESVGVVVESESDIYMKGDYLCVHKGWQTHIVANDEDPALFKADPSVVPLQTYLGTVGMPGRTAYFGLLRVGLPKSGETIVVSAASGAVGSVVGPTTEPTAPDAAETTIVSPDFGSPCLLYTSPSPRDLSTSRMPSFA